MKKFDVRGQVLWCDVCDQVQVNSDMPLTGTFYYQSGHVYQPRVKEKLGDYEMIVWAVCSDCEKAQ